MGPWARKIVSHFLYNGQWPLLGIFKQNILPVIVYIKVRPFTLCSQILSQDNKVVRNLLANLNVATTRAAVYVDVSSSRASSTVEPRLAYMIPQHRT